MGRHAGHGPRTDRWRRKVELADRELLLQPDRSGARLVTITRTSGPARSRSAWIPAAAGIRCSKLSRTTRIDRPARNAWSRSIGVVCGDSTRPKVPAIASRTSSGSSIPSRRTSHSVVEGRCPAARDLDGEAGLARAARSRQRDERRLGEQALQHVELAVPPDEAGQPARQVARRAVGSERREVEGKPSMTSW